MPDFEIENKYDGLIAGLDEAGRGAFAGPVVSAASAINIQKIEKNLLDRIDDSKKLTFQSRNEVFNAVVKSRYISFGVGISSVDEIDSLNILQSTFLSMKRALIVLESRLQKSIDFALVDGNNTPSLGRQVYPVVNGDSKSVSIATSSILAKVVRDRIMINLSKQYPEYGWEKNKGYGTKDHKIVLSNLGVTKLHRKSFRPISFLL